jgi:hypothetical protein
MSVLHQILSTHRLTPTRLLAAGVCAVAVLLGTGVAQAATARFVPNTVGDEVADTYTGLIWRRCAEGQSWDGTHCTGGYTTFTWDAALAHAQSEASRTSLAWRVPNVKELKSLVNPAASNPASYPIFPETPSDLFWASTPIAGDASYAWIVYFGNGYVDNHYGYRSYDYAVRLVRAGQ